MALPSNRDLADIPVNHGPILFAALNILASQPACGWQFLLYFRRQFSSQITGVFRIEWIAFAFMPSAMLSGHSLALTLRPYLLQRLRCRFRRRHAGWPVVSIDRLRDGHAVLTSQQLF